MKTVFIVDDNTVNRLSAKNALDKDYNTYAIESASNMFKLLEKITPDLILLDIEMPEMNGFKALKKLKSDSRYRDIPVMFLTAKIDPKVEIKGFEQGAIDFISKPFSPPVLVKRIDSHLETDKLIKESVKKAQNLHFATLGIIADMVGSRDVVTGKHIERTQEYLKILVEEMTQLGTYADEMSSWVMSYLLPSAQLHDLGKIKISDTILNKPDRLTDEEFAAIKTHCTMGEEVINEIINKTEEGDFLLHAKRFAASHHEKWNGTGYPRGLSGEDIPLEGRILAIADVYDALVSERPYKKPFTHDKAVDIIRSDSGTHFDPKIVEAFLNVTDKFKETAEMFAELHKQGADSKPSDNSAKSAANSTTGEDKQ